MFLLWFRHKSAGMPGTDILGLSLAKRGVLSAQSCGLEKITVVVHPEDAQSVKSDLDDYRVKVDVAVATDPESPSAAIGDEPELAFALGDRVWAKPALEALTRPLDETTKIKVLTQGKPDAPFSGLLRARADGIDEISLEPAATENEIVSSGSERMATVEIDRSWEPVSPDGKNPLAENLLLNALKKSADGIVSRHINRKISLFISRHLAKTGTRPNQVTAVVALVGLAAGPLAFFGGTYWGFAAGAFCYYFSAILDGCDGEISRLKYQGSPMGAWLDTIVDDLVCLSYITGLYGRLSLDNPGPFWFWTGIVGVGFFSLTVLPRYYVMAVVLGSGDYQKLAASKKKPEPKGFGKAVQAVKDVIFRTDFLPFYAFVTAACYYVPAFAVPFAVGSVASAVDSFIDLATARPKKS